MLFFFFSLALVDHLLFSVLYLHCLTAINSVTRIPLQAGFDLGFINEEEVNLFLFQSRVILPVLPIVSVSLYNHNLLVEDLFDY